nr:uncharacterized protein LOC111515069 isoform X2 [Leptinotarsa decemlineata]
MAGQYIMSKMPADENDNEPSGISKSEAGGIDTLEQKLDGILDNQVVLLKRIEKLELMFNEVLNLNRFLEEDENMTLEPFEPIDDVEELIKLEEILKDKVVFDKYVDSLRNICLEINNAIDNCYLLVDWFFTRKFMTKCSWSGASRQQNVKKIPLRTYENVIELFFQIIRLENNTFTMNDCKIFFLTVLKNAYRRNNDGYPPIRQSKTKNMISRCKTTKVVNTQEEEEEEESEKE